MTRDRCHLATLTRHELMLLALLRAADKDRQREIAGVLYKWACETQTALRFRDEGNALGVQHLEASVLRPFIDAARDVVGVAKRAA